MSKNPTNYDDCIDSRDVIKAIEELEDTVSQDDIDRLIESDEATELVALRDLARQGEGCADWLHGEQLIRDSYFVTHAQEMAEEIGAIPDNATWPRNYIDWEKAASALQMDYTSVDFGGVTYWIRS